MSGAISGSQTDRKLEEFQPDLVDHFLLLNHDEVVKILETKFYLGKAAMSKNLEAWFVDYINHVAVWHAMRHMPELSKQSPHALGYAWPGTGKNSPHPCPTEHPKTCFVDEIEASVTKLQTEYDKESQTLLRHVN